MLPIDRCEFHNFHLLPFAFDERSKSSLSLLFSSMWDFSISAAFMCVYICWGPIERKVDEEHKNFTSSNEYIKSISMFSEISCVYRGKIGWWRRENEAFGWMEMIRNDMICSTMLLFTLWVPLWIVLSYRIFSTICWDPTHNLLKLKKRKSHSKANEIIDFQLSRIFSQFNI